MCLGKAPCVGLLGCVPTDRDGCGPFRDNINLQCGDGSFEKDRHRTGRGDQRTHVAYGHTIRGFFSFSTFELPVEESMGKMFGLPVNQYTSSTVKPLLDEGIAGGKIFNDILIIHIIQLDDVVLEIDEEMVVKWQPQHRYYMCDIGLFQSVFGP